MLELRGVTRRFGRLTAVEKLNLSVEAGRIHGLIGPNGSGKSTTMNLIAGSLNPIAGTIHFGGDRIDGMPPDRLARAGLIRTFQLTRVFPDLTVFETVRLGALSGHGVFRPRAWLPFPRHSLAADKARECIERMGLTSHADHNAASLPGGKQRVLSIAVALATGPRMLLLDEPLAGLSATEKADVATRIGQLRADGITILLVEHDMTSVLRLCDRITVINFGARIAEGTPGEISRDPTVVKAYLGERGGRHAAN